MTGILVALSGNGLVWHSPLLSKGTERKCTSYSTAPPPPRIPVPVPDMELGIHQASTQH